MNCIFRLSCLIVSLLFAGNLFGQQKNNYTNKIDSLIQITTVRPFNGVILIAQDGKTKYSKAYGYSDFDKKIPIALNDQFVIMSNSKQITAVLVLQEVDKGHIHLQSPIKKYLPDLKQSWADTVTVHNLLNHTCGIVGLDEPLAFKSGTQFKYSDINYMLLGKIIESVTKDSYPEKANELFKKCGMKNTFVPNNNNQQRLIKGYGYSKDNARYEVHNIVIAKENFPSAGVITTANDLTIWDRKLHNNGLLKTSTYNLMISYSIKARHNAFGDKEIGYGYGIRINDLEKVKEFGHTGYGPNQGFTSLNIYYPDTKTSVIVLENQGYEDFDIAYYFESRIRQIIKQSILTNKDYLQ